MPNPNNPGDGKTSGDKGVDQGRSKDVKTTLVEAHFSQALQKALIEHTNFTKNPAKYK